MSNVLISHTHTHTHARREGGRVAILTRFPSWSNLQVVLVFLQLNSYYLDNYISDSQRIIKNYHFTEAHSCKIKAEYL